MMHRRRSLVTGLAVTLVAGLLGMVPGTPPVSAAPKDDSPRLVEQTETADIYANGDGTNTAVFYAGPVNFFDKTAKQWRKVDNQFRRRNNRIENSAATHLGEQNVPLQLIMAKTRHRSPRTAMRYIKPGPVAVAEVTELLDPPRRRG